MNWTAPKSSDPLKTGSDAHGGFEEPSGTNLGGTDTPGWAVLETPPEPWPVLGEPKQVKPALEELQPTVKVAPHSKRSRQDYFLMPASERLALGVGMLRVIWDALSREQDPAPDTVGAASLLAVISGYALIGIVPFAILVILAGSISGIVITALVAGACVGTLVIGLRRFRRDLKRRP